jgi:probable rRNA maturation factor
MVILRKRVVGLSEPVLSRFVVRAAKAARLKGSANVLVTTSRELRALNQRFRGQDHPTDVLSFPPVLGMGAGFAGDIAISADIAAHNARRLGHAAAQEIKILVLHGVLHLAGHDHERDHGEMKRKEERLRRVLGLPVGLIARNGRVVIGDGKSLTAEKVAPPKPLAGRSARATPASQRRSG